MGLFDCQCPAFQFESMDNSQTNSGGEDLHNVSDTSTESNPPSGKPDKMLGISHFFDLLGTKEERFYIDKTELADVFVKCNRSRVLVTAPRRFGKTTNMAMFKAVFELQIPAEESKTLSEKDLQRKIKETDNYKLFQEHNLLISRNSDFMEKHFGKYPVIHISFKCDVLIENLDDAILCCMRAISETFREHKFLQSSTSLDRDEKNECRKWCKREWDIKNRDDRQEVSTGLQTLARYLYKHFGRKIVLLVDEYDSVITTAMLDLKCVDEFKKVVRFCTGVIRTAVKENNTAQNWIEYAFITGISHIAGMGLSGSNVKPYRFLEEHPFVPFYGLTATETEVILEKTYKFNAERIAEAKHKFNGYCTVGGKNMYNIWSLLEYAGKKNEIEETYEWKDTGYIEGLEEAFRIPEIKRRIETELLLDNPIKEGKQKVFCLKDLLHLMRIIRKLDDDIRDVSCPHPEIFFSFLLEQGYLSFVAKSPGLLVIPNQQIKEEFEKKLTKFKIAVLSAVDPKCFNNCREFLLNISQTDCDHDYFRKFHMNVEILLQKDSASWLKKNEENIRCTISTLANNLGFTKCGELLFQFEDMGRRYTRKIDYMITKDNFAMIIEIKYKRSNAEALLCIRDKNYCKVFDAKDIFRNRVTHYVLMGINMDDNGQVSIGYLQDNHNFDDMKLIP